MGSAAAKGNLRYGRVLLKLSGEALAGDEKRDIDPGIINAVAAGIREVHELGVEIGMVIGAGNIFRGAAAGRLGIDRVTGDQMGMIATVMNALAMKSVLENIGVETSVLSAIGMRGVADDYTVARARRHLARGRVVIAAGGTGHPFFTTDTAASLRAIELEADVLLKATRVDGVYTGDPEKEPDAKKFESISYIDVITKNLRVMDLTAVSLCRDNRLPMVVFNLFQKDALKGIVTGKKIGTIIT